MVSYNLSLSGGAARGAFQAGALYRLSQSDIKINSISGASVGALNGAMFSQGKIEEMLSIWRSLSPAFLLRFKSNLRKLIEENVDVKELRIPFSVLLLSLEDGYSFYVSPKENKELHDMIFKSSNFLGIIGKEDLIDPGIIDSVPTIKSAISIICTPPISRDWQDTGLISRLNRASDLSANEKIKYDLSRDNLIIRSNINTSRLDFSKKTINNLIQHGIDSADLLISTINSN